MSVNEMLLNNTYESLVCDGIVDCPYGQTPGDDLSFGSDENQTFCRRCPRKGGHPRGKSKYATLSCKHRYTKNWICSVPCDGIDDLCENFEDEKCSPDSTTFIIITTLGLSALLIITISIGNFVIKEEGMLKDDQVATGNNLEDVITLLSEIENAHKAHEYVANRMEVFYPYRELVGQLCEDRSNFRAKMIMKLEFCYHQCSLSETLMCLSSNLGTNSCTKLLLQCLREKHSSCFKFKTCFAQVKQQLVFVLRRKVFTQAIFLMKSMLQIVTYYIDLIKDLYLFFSLVSIVREDCSYSSFKWQILFLTTVSIAIPEVVTFFSLAHLTFARKLKKATGVIFCIFSLCAPAVTIYIVGILEARHHFKFSQQAWTLWKSRCSLFKIIQVVFENTIQIYILLIVILISKSKTNTVHGLESLIANDDIEILVASCLWSFISIVLAEVKWKDSLKNFTIGIMGKCYITAFFSLSVVARTIAVIIYFAPSMGLLDLMGHFTMGEIRAAQYPKYEIEKSGNQITLAEVWIRINQSSDLSVLKLQTFYIIFAVFIALHQAWVLIINKCIYAKNNLKEKNFFFKLLSIISQQLGPNIYQDWDENASTRDEAKKNYELMKKEMKALLTLFAVENILLCTPLMMLSYKIYERNKYLDEFFPQLDEEIWSTRLAYCLSALCPILFCAIPFLQYWLFLLYNKYGHPWALLLQDNLDAPDWLKNDDIFMDEMMKADLGESADEVKKIFKLKFSGASQVQSPVFNHEEMRDI